MLICRPCFEKEEAKLDKDVDVTWDTAPKLYEQCEFCKRSCLCAEI